jgi:hypothetical protein
LRKCFLHKSSEEQKTPKRQKLSSGRFLEPVNQEKEMLQSQERFLEPAIPEKEILRSPRKVLGARKPLKREDMVAKKGSWKSSPFNCVKVSTMIFNLNKMNWYSEQELFRIYIEGRA